MLRITTELRLLAAPMTSTDRHVPDLWIRLCAAAKRWPLRNKKPRHGHLGHAEVDLSSEQRSNLLQYSTYIHNQINLIMNISFSSENEILIVLF